MIAEGDDKSKAIEATGLLHQVNSFKFLSCLIIFHQLLGVTKSLSDQLQSKDIDLHSATELVVSTRDTLKSLRNDETWNHTFKYIADVASLHDINLEETRQRRRPRRMDEFASSSSIGHRDSLDSSQSLKLNIYFPVLDTILSEIDRRFTSINLGIMKSLQACHPLSETFLELSQFDDLTSMYNVDTILLETECLLAKKTFSTQNMESIIDVYRKILPLKEAFPTLQKIFQIGLTLAVSTAQCERSFSALKRIKTYLRTTMTEQRLTDIAILSIEREISAKIKLEEAFEGTDKNRQIVLS